MQFDRTRRSVVNSFRVDGDEFVVRVLHGMRSNDAYTSLALLCHTMKIPPAVFDPNVDAYFVELNWPNSRQQKYESALFDSIQRFMFASTGIEMTEERFGREHAVAHLRSDAWRRLSILVNMQQMFESYATRVLPVFPVVVRAFEVALAAFEPTCGIFYTGPVGDENKAFVLACAARGFYSVCHRKTLKNSAGSHTQMTAMATLMRGLDPNEPVSLFSAFEDDCIQTNKRRVGPQTATMDDVVVGLLASVGMMQRKYGFGKALVDVLGETIQTFVNIELRFKDNTMTETDARFLPHMLLARHIWNKGERLVHAIKLVPWSLFGLDGNHDFVAAIIAASPVARAIDQHKIPLYFLLYDLAFNGDAIGLSAETRKAVLRALLVDNSRCATKGSSQKTVDVLPSWEAIRNNTGPGHDEHDALASLCHIVRNMEINMLATGCSSHMPTAQYYYEHRLCEEKCCAETPIARAYCPFALVYHGFFNWFPTMTDVALNLHEEHVLAKVDSEVLKTVLEAPLQRTDTRNIADALAWIESAPTDPSGKRYGTNCWLRELARLGPRRSQHNARLIQRPLLESDEEPESDNQSDSEYSTVEFERQ